MSTLVSSIVPADQWIEAVAQAYISPTYMAWGFYIINSICLGDLLWVSFNLVPLSEGPVVGLDCLH